MLCAIVNDGVVQKIDDLQEEEIRNLSSQCEIVLIIDGLDPQPAVGWIFNGQILIDPSGTSLPDLNITKFAFRARLTFEELCLVTAAASGDIRVKVLLDNLSVSESINLGDQEVAMGLGLLVSLDLLTQDRMIEILQNEVQDHERHRSQ